MFTTHTDHFAVSFHNGWTFSVTWREGTYTRRKDDVVTHAEAAAYRTESRTASTRYSSQRGSDGSNPVWFHFDEETAPEWAYIGTSFDDVQPALTPEQVVEFMQIVANLEDE